MKNMWKERFDNCEAVNNFGCYSREHLIFGTMAEALNTYGKKPVRGDVEVKVESLGDGRFLIVQEAPFQEPIAGKFWLHGFRTQSIVHLYTRGKKEYIKLESFKVLHLNPQGDTSRDYIVEKSCVHGVAVEGSFLTDIVKWIRTSL